MSVKWGEYPFTNIIGERSLRLKPEGHSFEIIAGDKGVRLQGESHWLSDKEDLENLALQFAKAFKFYEWALREKSGLKAKEAPPKKLILPTGEDHAV